MEADLPTKLRAWLASEGYPFELQMGRALREAGWQVFHGQHYSDPETGKLREIDLHAAWGPFVGDEQGLVGVHLVCECKVSQGKPWVVFTSRDSDSLDRMAGHLAPGPLAARALAHGVLTNRDKVSTFLTGPRIGHGVTKGFTESRGGDPTGPFAAIMGALTAASALSREHYSMLLRHGGGATVWIAIHVPLVILSGHLFEFYLDESGREVLEECDRVHVLAHGPGGRDLVLVQIVSAPAMLNFARVALDDARSVAQVILPEARAMWASFRQGPEAIGL